MTICSAADCDNKVSCKGLCAKHYQRLRCHGDVRTSYKSRMHRVLINDLSTYQHDYVTAYERQALREIFFRGKYHGSLSINYNECTGGDW